MTSLHLTTMALCCGVGMNVKSSVHFVRRAVDAQIRKLIDDFVSNSLNTSWHNQALMRSQPSYQCIHQWDALHALLLYEILELRESLDEEFEDWKHKPRVKGLRSPFLLKV
jgi:hypothetical protein